MAPAPELVAYVVELMGTDIAPAPRRMFGGWGLFVGDVMFALIFSDRLYLRVDDDTRPNFEARGLAPFSYDRRDGPREMRSYFEAPDTVFDDPEEMAEWARQALDAAFRVRAAKTRSNRR